MVAFGAEAFVKAVKIVEQGRDVGAVLALDPTALNYRSDYDLVKGGLSSTDVTLHWCWRVRLQ